MKQPSELLVGTAFAVALLLVMATPEAQESRDSNVPPATAAKQAAEIARGDPPRWYHEDRTLQARLRTLHKEIGAGLQEAQGACRSQPAAERGACLREARAAYQRDMAGARALAMQEMAQH
jgi:hypothetical protein